jgi:hypothetical protein
VLPSHGRCPMKTCLLLVSALLALALPAGKTQAAPQMLGVVASADPIPMTCEDGQCSVELSAFCLQQARTGPRDGTAYQAVDAAPLTLVATLADGSTRRLSAAPYVRFANARSYSAVTASVDEALPERLGARKLALVVGPDLTLMPVASAGDPEPLTPGEIDQARRNLREIAADLLESDAAPGMTTVHVINRLINALPNEANSVTIDIASRDGLWGQVIGGTPRVDDPNPGMAQAALAFESCRRGATYVQGLTLRRCLEASHDALMSSVNEEIWKVVGAGS